MSGSGTIFLTISGLIYTVITTFLFINKKKVNKLENRIFKKLLFITIISMICELFIVVTNGIPIISTLIQKLFLVCIILWLCQFMVYTFSITKFDNKLSDEDNIKKYWKFYKCFIIINFLISAVIIFLPIYFNNSENIKYTYGPSVDVVFGTTAVYMIFMFIMLLINLSNIRKKGYLPIIVLLILLSCSALIQNINPGILLTNYVFSLIIYIMYHTIENPDMKLIHQLDMAKSQAEKSNNAKTDFLSSMSHEIRTPLNAIVGFSSCIDAATTLEEAKENAKDIVNASGTLLEIVNSILDISKIESGKIEIVNSSYKPSEKFYELASLMKNKMTEKGLDFQVNIASDLPNYLYGDYSSIKKVVTNLLSNAYKYTDKGFVKYDVSCVNKEDVCRLIISIEDSGRGIKKENVDKLFTKFQRLEEDRNTTIEGTGLGLAITKQLVNMMGGEIILHTVYKEGSKFTVVLDQKIDFNVTLDDSISYDDYKKGFDLTGKKILVVDDNNLNLKIATKILNKYNADVITMDSGFLCIESIINNDYYDLILMDDMMPKMSGTETLIKLKNIKNFDIPVVCLTANAIEGMREKYLSIGFDDYLAKPIDDKELIKVLSNIINKTKDNKKNKVDFGELPSSIYEIGNNDKISISQPIIYEDELIEVISDESDYYYDNISDNSYDVNYLKENNIDVDHALSLLGDLDMYHETMKDFMSEVNEKFDKIKQYKDSGDMSNYAILVHSLKSDSKYLGFMKLADISYQHELKSKENDIEFVSNNFSLLEEELDKIINIVKEYLKHI